VVFLFPDPRYPFVKADLLGDDISTPSDPVVAVPGNHKTNEDLLAEIFGGTAMSTTTNAATPTPASSQPQKTTAADILGLFDSPAPSASPQAQQAPPSAAMSLFDLSTPVTPAAPPPKPAAPDLPSYTAYNKNDVVISLTPQRSTTQPGVVDILAQFQVKGSTVATGLNFQVAVPKVSNSQSPSPTLQVPDGVYPFFLFSANRQQTQQLQMQPMSRQDVNPGATETQQMRITAPIGVSIAFATSCTPLTGFLGVVGAARHTG
jgi:AP-1 complex subunit gamma-1